MDGQLRKIKINIFLTKNHEGKKRIYLENYLEKFFRKNIFANNIFFN